MQEAFKKELNDHPDSPIASLVQGVVDNVAQTESEHDRFVQSTVDNIQGWTQICDECTRLGAEYSSANTSFDDDRREATIEAVRQKVSVLIPQMMEWGGEGIIHLLGNIDRGLRRYSPLPYEGVSFGLMLESEWGARKPISGLHAQTFLDEFKDLLDLNEQEADDLDQFLLRQQPSEQDSRLGYTQINKVFPILAKWIQAKYSPPDETK